MDNFLFLKLISQYFKYQCKINKKIPVTLIFKKIIKMEFKKYAQNTLVGIFLSSKNCHRPVWLNICKSTLLVYNSLL
jgi:hypothetical protein